MSELRSEEEYAALRIREIAQEAIVREARAMYWGGSYNWAGDLVAEARKLGPLTGRAADLAEIIDAKLERLGWRRAA